MAPTSKDPRELQHVLNPARRRALISLATSITTQMRADVCDSFDEPADVAPLFVSQRSHSGSSRDWASPPPTTTTEGKDSARGFQQQQKQQQEDESQQPRRKIQALRRAALAHFDAWESAISSSINSVLNAPVDPRAVQERERAARAARAAEPPALLEIDPDAELLAAEASSRSSLQKRYPPVPTRLATIPKSDLQTVVSSVLLLLLSQGQYSAQSRVFLLYLASSFQLPLSFLVGEETELARTLVLVSSQAETLTAEAEAEAKRKAAENATSRRWKVGLASIAGAAVIGVTGGLAAPIVAGAIGGLMGAVGLGGVASFLGVFAMNGALMGSVFGVLGAKGAAQRMEKYVGEVKDFRFLALGRRSGEVVDGDGRPVETPEEHKDEDRRLRVTIGINGWLNSKDDVITPWEVLGQDTEVFALRYEMEALLELGASLQTMVSSYAWSFVKMEILRKTVLATLWASLWPVYLVKMATSVDSPFAMAKSRSEKAGEVLADALINRAQGNRPVTLVGYSLGARVVYSCLNSLAERKAFGLVDDVVFIAAPVPSNPWNWRVLRSVVSGKVTNVYSENDYILAFLYRATSIQYGVAGLQEIKNVPGVGNLDLSSEVSGHLRYPELIGQILKRVSFTDVRVADAIIAEEVEPDKDVAIATDYDFDAVELARERFAELHAGPPLEPKTVRRGEEKVPASMKEELMQARSLAATDGSVEGGSGHGRTPEISVIAHEREYDSEGDVGGIQMLDNDS